MFRIWNASPLSPNPTIAALVARFYAKARLDPLIGPVFNDAVEDWDEHLRTLNAFWSSVMLTSGRYKGNPMAAHLKLPIEPRFFERWLALWRETAAELFAPDLAAAIRRQGRTHRREPQARAVLPARSGCFCPCRGVTAAAPCGLPDGLVAYRRTPVFDQDTIPAGLRREHRTASGVWGLITVLEGRLRFRSLQPVAETVLTPGAPMAVAPQQPHEVAPDGPVRFYVEFYRTADPVSSDANRA